MVVALIAIIAFGIGVFIVNAMQAWVLITGRQSALMSAQNAMNRMVSELRRVRKAQNILVWTASEVQFIDISVDNIDFKQDGANLLRNDAVLATGLPTGEGLRFTYLGSTGEVVSQKQDIRSIRVWLQLRASGQRTTLESSARIRNP
jgi:hypothetical protein